MINARMINAPPPRVMKGGSTIELEVIQHIRATFWECAAGFQWRPEDLLALDNLAVRHGRIGWTGERKLLAYLTF